jgi:monofunctional biosynthetic peptidoglycan transglycosylase
VSKNTQTFFSRIWHFLWKAALAFLCLSIGTVILFRWVPVPITPLMLIRCVEQKVNDKPLCLKKDWMPLEKISGDLQLAVVCSEDQNFLKHRGFDYDAIERAMDYNGSHKHKRGASTISQQTAKNVFLWPGRSWIRKAFEVYFTFLIETCWSKERIMTVYLNVIEMGDGIYGAEAASHAYFRKSAQHINENESATLAAILPNPRRFSAVRPDYFVSTRRGWILNQMVLWGRVLNYAESKK